MSAPDAFQEVERSLVVVTGLSGAGKSTALHALADVGYYCVDNLPPALVSKTVQTCGEAGIARIALGIDIRVGAFLDAAEGAIEDLQGHPAGLQVVFLESADDALVRRFSETRRPHPMQTKVAKEVGSSGPFAVADGVRLERVRLASLRDLATMILDTTHMSVHELRRDVIAKFSPSSAAGPRMLVRMLSFGFKHGIPLDADLVFDVRFLDNPHFVRGLRELTGEDGLVREFVLASPGCAELLGHLDTLLDFALPRYQSEGKSYLTVAIGCTGGRHRSVAIAVAMARGLSERLGQPVGIIHRDAARGAMMKQAESARSLAKADWSRPSPSPPEVGDVAESADSTDEEGTGA